MINLSKKYSTVIPNNIDKRKLEVRSIFLVEGSEIVTVLEYYQERLYLVFHSDKETKWHPLISLSTVHQLSKTEIVVYHIDESIDMIQKNKNKWETVRIRERKNVFMKNYQSKLILFSKTRLICIREWSPDKFMNIVFLSEDKNTEWREHSSYKFEYTNA